MAERSDDAGPGDEEAPIGGYAEALAEIDEILAAIDDPDLDVDLLGSRVRRATALIEHCRRRIAAARLEVATATEPVAPGDDADAAAGRAG
jgi:exodeoxyribonuclease VII small subunit